MDRPSWDQIWMRFSHSISERSCDPKNRVGAIIVTDDNTQVLAVGYNGDQKGGNNTRDSLDPGKSGFIHAEINALIKCDYNCPKSKIMYVTHSPCKMCAKSIINANISEVVYDNIYWDTEGLEILKKSGVKSRKF